MEKNLLKTTLGWLRLVGFMEGASFLVLLLIAMPLKYFAGMPEAVRVIGMAHGVLFVLYCILVIQVTVERKWPFSTLALALIASVLPAGPFIAERKLFR